MVLDTNIVIAYLGGDERVIKTIAQWFLERRRLIISIVTYVEVLSMREATEIQLTVMRQFLNYLVVIDLDKHLAEEVAYVRRVERLKFPDAAIVATSRMTNTPLVTRDKRLLKVKDLIIEEI